MSKPLTIAVVLLLLCITVALGKRRSRAASNFVPHGDNPNIPLVDATNFRDVVLMTSEPVVLILYKTEDESASKAIAAVMDNLANEFKQLFRFGYVDSSSESGKQLLSSFSVSQFPAIVMFNSDMHAVPGGDASQLMKQPIGYSGDGTAVGIARWMLQSVTTDHIERVSNDHELAEWLGKYTFVNELPGFLYITNKPYVSPLFTAVAHKHRYAGSYAVAFQNNSQEILSRYHIAQAPALLALVPLLGGQTHEVRVMETLLPETTFEDLSRFITENGLSAEAQGLIQQFFYQEDAKLRAKQQEHAKLGKVLKPILIQSRKQWVHECLTRKKGYCLAVFLEEVEDQTIDFPEVMLEQVSHNIAAKLSSSQQVQIVAVDGTKNYEIANHFSMINGLPDALLFNPAKREYWKLIGSVTEKGLSNFVLERLVAKTGGRFAPKSYKAKQVPKYYAKKSFKPDEETTEDDASQSEL